MNFESNELGNELDKIEGIQQLINSDQLLSINGIRRAKELVGIKSRPSHERSPYAFKRRELPQNYDLLNATGVHFARYRNHAGRFFLPYENVILAKYGEFIEQGFTPSLYTEFGGEIRQTIQPLRPAEKVGYFSSRIKSNQDVPYIYDQETQFIGMNVERPHKGEIFTKAALERYTINGYETLDGDFISKKGFSVCEYDEHGNLVYKENKELYDGLLLLLSEEVIYAVTKTNPRVLLKPTKDCKHPYQLINIARDIRELVNLNQEGGIYSPEKDVFVYDFFVNNDLSRTEEVIDSKFGRRAFENLNDLIAKVDKASCKARVDEAFEKVEDMLGWMKNAK